MGSDVIDGPEAELERPAFEPACVESGGRVAVGAGPGGAGSATRARCPTMKPVSRTEIMATLANF